jgi:hypothetical protein
MHKKIFTAVLVMFFVAALAYSQTLEVSGEMKTGVFWEKIDLPGTQSDEEIAKMHNNDDAGPNEGRFRMNLHVKKDIIGMKIRFEQTAWSATSPNVWAFAFAYGNFIDEQLRVVVGRLGESPWSAGGPDIWQELDNQVGIRFEVKPNIVPGLNVGLVLNGWNNSNYFPEHNTLVDLLSETVFGIAYTNDYFHGRFAYRLDGESDVYDVQEGMELMYRLEERVLQNYVDGLQLWVNGWWRGIGTEKEKNQNNVTRVYTNWFYAQWAPENFTAQLRLGYHKGVQFDNLQTRLSFYYNIFPWLSAGAAFNFDVDVGNESVKDIPYRIWNIEPQVKFTFATGTYVAFVYQYESEPINKDKIKQTQRINLRTVFTF